MCLSGVAHGPLERLGGTVQAQRDQAPPQSPWGARYKLGETPPLQSPIPTRTTSLSAAAGDCEVLPVAQAIVASCFTIHGTEFRGACPLKGIGFRVTWGVWVAGPTTLPSSAQDLGTLGRGAGSQRELRGVLPPLMGPLWVGFC